MGMLHTSLQLTFKICSFEIEDFDIIVKDFLIYSIITYFHSNWLWV